jgi:predicted RNase H-like nuclease
MLPPPVVLVTSAPALMRGQIGNLLVEEKGNWLFEHPALATAAKGTGDLLAALLLARRLEGRDWSEATRIALASVFDIVFGTARAGADELLLPQLQESLLAPRAQIGVRLGAGAAAASHPEEPRWVAGVDGCRGGWLAVFLDTTGREPPRVRPFARFADVLVAAEAPVRIAVDMPIGLPDRIEGSGRAAEMAIRPLLGPRQSSVFSMPSRAAVMCHDYDEACRVALANSSPPRRVVRQGFALFPKIRELDQFMTAELSEQVIETHPEVAFRELNGGTPMSQPKKVKGQTSPRGLEERKLLLMRFGFDHAFLDQRPPPGAGSDDLVDACVSALVAKRHLDGVAVSYPNPPARDGRGLPIAIWA